MKSDDAYRITKLLSGSSGARGAEHSLRVDTFRHSYARFTESFTLPSIDLSEIRQDEAYQLSLLLKERLPAYAADAHCLPEARPRKESHMLHLVREIRVEEASYVYLFKINPQYMGGASDEEYVTMPEQGRSPSIRTDRLYFDARLIPVSAVERGRNSQILDFRPRRIREALTQVVRSDSLDERRWATALFDDLDFGALNQEFTRRLDFTDAGWPLRNVVDPLRVDFLTLTLNLLDPDPALTEALAPRFHEVFERVARGEDLRDLPTDQREFWARYYRAWEYEPAPSRSGNPHWKLTRTPDPAELTQ